MPKIPDEAIILKLTQAGEADLIVHMLMRDRGRRSAVAKSARKSRKRFAGSLQPFCHLNVVTDTRRTRRLDRLDQVDLIGSFHDLRKDLGRICMASYFCELLDQLLMEGETYPEVFELILYFLDRLQRRQVSLKHRLFFEIRLLDLLGFRPELKYCSESGEVLSGTAFYDPTRQVILGGEAAVMYQNLLPLSQSCRDSMLEVGRVPLHGLEAVRMGNSAAREALILTRALIREIAPRPLKSLAMLDTELGL